MTQARLNWLVHLSYLLAAKVMFSGIELGWRGGRSVSDGFGKPGSWAGMAERPGLSARILTSGLLDFLHPVLSN